MDNIECSSDIKDKAKTLEECRADIESCKSDLDNALGDVSEAWQGADATKYIDKMRDDYLFSFDGLLAGLDECINFLNTNVPVKYEDDDKEFAGRSIT